jgi:ABC-type multidrug transport system fused ATPase/permease subunit
MPFRDLLILAKPFRLQLILLGLLSIAGSAVTLAIPALGARLLGGLLGESALPAGAVAALLAAAVVLTAITSGYLRAISSIQALTLLTRCEKPTFLYCSK